MGGGYIEQVFRGGGSTELEWVRAGVVLPLLWVKAAATRRRDRVVRDRISLSGKGNI